MSLHLSNAAARGDNVNARLDNVDREELRKLTESISVRHALNPFSMARLVALGYARAVMGGWEITEAGWLALERTRIPNALK